MLVASFSLLFSSSHRLPYIHGQSMGVRACRSTISNLERLDMLPRIGFSMGEVGFTTIERSGWSIADIMDANLVVASSIQRFLSSKIRFKLFQATHAQGLSNNQVIKWYLSLELRGRCLLLRFLSTSSHLHIVYPISMANQREFELMEAQSQTLKGP